MRQYWLRISLGALAIFGVGMLGVHVVRQGSSKVHRLMESSDPISLPLAFVPFRLGGEDLGAIRNLRLSRSAPDRVDSIQLVVRLDQAAFAARLADCRLSPADGQSLGPQTSFRCASPQDSVQMHLVPFGTVRFEPTGEQRALWLPAEMVGQWRTAARPRGALAPPSPAAPEAVPAALAEAGMVGPGHGSTPVQLRLRGDSSTVAIDGQADGSHLTFRADSTGAFLRVRDAKGRDVVLLRADSSGAVFNVNGDTGSRHRTGH